jgi:hypothetical protein
MADIGRAPFLLCLVNVGKTADFRYNTRFRSGSLIKNNAETRA